MKVVLSIGGSMIVPDGKPDIGFLKQMAKLINESKHEFGILCGGGSVARECANAARAVGAGEYEADNIAIMSTKQNAYLLMIALLGEGIDVERKVFDSFNEAKRSERKVVVMGGTIPGITTDADAVLLGEAIGAKRLVNISNVDAIYDSDPKKNLKARKFSKITYEQLIALAVSSDKRMAGTNFVFDMLACKLIPAWVAYPAACCGHLNSFFQ